MENFDLLPGGIGEKHWLKHRTRTMLMVKLVIITISDPDDLRQARWEYWNI